MLYRTHLSQISFFSLLAVATILFSSCVHDLVDEGVYSSTIVRGTVLDQRSHQPVAALHVRLMHDGHTLHAAVTSFDGTFQLPLQFDELHRGVRLEVYLRWHFSRPPTPRLWPSVLRRGHSLRSRF